MHLNTRFSLSADWSLSAHWRRDARFALPTVALLVSAILVVGCSRDPEARKRRFLESGHAYFKQQKFREAAIEYRNAVQIDARFGEARVALAEAFERLADVGGAMREYIRAADLLPGRADVQVKAGTYLLAARKPQEALVRADAALK